jgi:N6-L-threonylcarbamoyladenine synthase
VFEPLVRKSKLALERGMYRSFGLSGGVANNQTLQRELEKLAREQGVAFHRAQSQHTGDNAGMIAFAAFAEREPGGVNETGYALQIAPSQPLAIA